MNDVTLTILDAVRGIDGLPATAHTGWYGATQRLEVLWLLDMAIGFASDPAENP